MHHSVLRLSRRFPAGCALLFFSFLFPAPSYAALYKCEFEGTVTYSDRPCNGRHTEPPALSTPLVSPASKNGPPGSLAREKAELSQLQNLREQRERQDQQIRDLARRGYAAKQKKCRTLALEAKWKQEDADLAEPKSKASAIRKARRSTEKFQTECG